MFKKWYMIWAYKKPDNMFMPNTMLDLIWQVTQDSPALFQAKNPHLIPTLWYPLSRREYRRVATVLGSRKRKEEVEGYVPCNYTPPRIF